MAGQLQEKPLLSRKPENQFVPHESKRSVLKRRERERESSHGGGGVSQGIKERVKTSVKERRKVKTVSVKSKLVMERLGHKGVDKMKNTSYDEGMVLKNHCYQRIEASINVTSRGKQQGFA